MPLYLLGYLEFITMLTGNLTYVPGYGESKASDRDKARAGLVGVDLEASSEHSQKWHSYIQASLLSARGVWIEEVIKRVPHTVVFDFTPHVVLFVSRRRRAARADCRVCLAKKYSRSFIP